MSPTVVYTSTLTRAVETAQTIARACGGVEVIADAGLREIDFGEVEGLGFDELPAELQSGLLEAPTRVRFPGGETYAELQSRVVASLENIVRAHPDGTVVAVSHAGAIRAAVAAWLLMADDAVFRVDQRYGAVNVVDWLEGVPLVRLLNGTAP